MDLCKQLEFILIGIMHSFRMGIYFLGFIKNVLQKECLASSYDWKLRLSSRKLQLWAQF